jgi:hypothetical protein
MSKGIKILVSIVALGGLGYFLYKKGYFSNSKTTIKNNEPIPVITEPIEEVKIIKDPIIGTPIQKKVEDLVYNDSYYEAKSTNPIVVDKFGDEKPITFDEQFGNGGFFGNNNINNSSGLDFKLGINENYKYR